MAKETEVNTPNLVAKITMKTLGVSPAKHATDKGAPIAVVMGMASGIKEVVDKVRGDVYHALVGEFEAENLETGEVFRSGVLYLPAGIHDMVEGAVKKLQGESDFVQFALQINVIKSASSAGYAYQAKSLIQNRQVDPLNDLRASLATSAEKPALTDGKAAAKK